MKFLSNKEKKNLSEQLPKGYKIDKKEEIKINEDLLLKNDKPYLIELGKTLVPHLKSIPSTEYKAVYVDRGAIPFLIKGADMMRPGIQKIEHPFDKNEIIIVRDEEHKKNLALGFALYNSKEMENLEKGKVVEIFHYTGDKWY